MPPPAQPAKEKKPRTKKATGSQPGDQLPADPAPPKEVASHRTEIVPIASLRPHPRNYRTHPEDQLLHIMESIRQHGFYRNVVTARDLTILAGHGITEAANRLGITEVPIFRLDLDADDPRALKVITGDNELGRFAEVDDRQLTELLKEINDFDVSGLVGTGFDEKMLAALVFNTRPASEVATMDEAAEWAAAGMPEYEPQSPLSHTGFRLLLHFQSEEERTAYVEQHGIITHKRLKAVWIAPWPPRGRDDIASLRFQEEPEAEPA